MHLDSMGADISLHPSEVFSGRSAIQTTYPGVHCLPASACKHGLTALNAPEFCSASLSRCTHTPYAAICDSL